MPLSFNILFTGPPSSVMIPNGYEVCPLHYTHDCQKAYGLPRVDPDALQFSLDIICHSIAMIGLRFLSFKCKVLSFGRIFSGPNFVYVLVLNWAITYSPNDSYQLSKSGILV